MIESAIGKYCFSFIHPALQIQAHLHYNQHSTKKKKKYISFSISFSLSKWEKIDFLVIHFFLFFSFPDIPLQIAFQGTD
jgi:hypothetical protein